MANILAGPLIELAPILTAACEPGGVLAAVGTAEDTSLRGKGRLQRRVLLWCKSSSATTGAASTRGEGPKLYTQCSKCETVFKLVGGVLRAAGGQVRCGRCGEVFNALARLAEDSSGVHHRANRRSNWKRAPTASLESVARAARRPDRRPGNRGIRPAERRVRACRAPAWHPATCLISGRRGRRSLAVRRAVRRDRRPRHRQPTQGQPDDRLLECSPCRPASSIGYSSNPRRRRVADRRAGPPRPHVARTPPTRRRPAAAVDAAGGDPAISAPGPAAARRRAPPYRPPAAARGWPAGSAAARRRAPFAIPEVPDQVRRDLLAGFEQP